MALPTFIKLWTSLYCIILWRCNTLQHSVMLCSILLLQYYCSYCISDTAILFSTVLLTFLYCTIISYCILMIYLSIFIKYIGLHSGQHPHISSHILIIFIYISHSYIASELSFPTLTLLFTIWYPPSPVKDSEQCWSTPWWTNYWHVWDVGQTGAPQPFMVFFFVLFEWFILNRENRHLKRRHTT